MISKKEQTVPAVHKLPAVPEHYLYWTYLRRQFLQPELRSLEGEPLEIVETGYQNPDDGPDFLDAVICIGGVLHRGDVEFHLRWEDWFRHGHHEDRRYRRVILHGLWFPPGDEPLPLSRRFRHLVISQNLAHSLDSWLISMRTLEEERGMPGNDAATGRLLPAQLRALAWQRFRRKCDQLRTWVQQSGWETALYMGLARVLGYRQNRQPFTELMRNFPPDRLLSSVHPLRRSAVLFWMLLGWQSGLFDRPFVQSVSPAGKSLLRQLQQVRQEFISRFPCRKQPFIQWHFARLRPLNNPYFRLAGLAQVLFEYQGHSLFEKLLHLLMQRLPLERVFDAAEPALCLPLSPAFAPFFSQLLGYRQIPKQSMGRIRCRQFLLNIVLPLIYFWAETTHNPGFRWYLEDLYFQFPVVDDNRVVRMFSDRKKIAHSDRAYVGQALLEISGQPNTEPESQPLPQLP